jgi:acetyl-CoA carboxylase/biotin carboxylase 1
MVVALKELSIRGDIRTTIEYLPKVLETADFRNNNVNTTWLERVMALQAVQAEKPDAFLVVIMGALFRAFNISAARMNEYMQTLERGQMPSQSLHSELVDVKVELIYDKRKYVFTVTRSAPNSFDLAVVSSKRVISADCHTLADGGLLVLLDGKKHVVYGQDFPSGLRLTVDGKTCLFSVEYDPTQLRSAMAGKLVRLV